jgi:hypothetical protein
MLLNLLLVTFLTPVAVLQSMFFRQVSVKRWEESLDMQLEPETIKEEGSMAVTEGVYLRDSSLV